MEFPAGTVTNFHAIDDITKLYCRLYCTKSLAASGFGGPNGHSGNLEAAVLTLREAGWLASVIPTAHGLWLFSEEQNFHGLRPFAASVDDATCNVIMVDGFEFHNCVFGAITVAELAKRFMSDPNAGLLLSGIFHGQIPEGFPLSPPVQSMTTFYVLYMAFISSVAGLLVLRATIRYGAIPLGRRTIVTATDSDGYERRTSSLFERVSFWVSTLNIDITSQGKLVISWRSIPQPGLEQHLSTLSGNVVTPQFNEDVWISPTGTIGRYISTTDPGTPDTVQTRLWKQAACDWFRKHGIDTNMLEEGIWVEMEIVNPSIPQGNNIKMDREGGDTPSPFSRILWPAKLCFRRAKTLQNPKELEFFKQDIDSPLHFAEKWMADSVSNKITTEPNIHARLAAKLEQGQTKVPSPLAASNRDTSDNITSLARTINFPDANLASAVYPTPPGAGLPPQYTAPSMSEPLDSVTTYVLNNTQEQQTPYPTEDVPSANFRADSDVVMGDIDSHSSQLGMRSGLYDTGADDLFGDLDEDFNTKEVTEADFNFFDEPDVGGLQNNGSDVQPPAAGDAPAVTTDSLNRLEKKTSQMEIAVPDEFKGCETTTEKGPSIMGSSKTDSAAKPDIAINDANANAAQDSNAVQFRQRRPSSPPLNPAQVKNILFTQGLNNGSHSRPPVNDGWKQPEGRYHAINFQQALGSADQKYQRAGRFWFMPRETKPNQGTKYRSYPEDIPVLGHRRKRLIAHGNDDVATWDDHDSLSSSSAMSSEDEVPPSIMMSEASTPESGRPNPKGQQSPAVGPETETHSQLSTIDAGSILVQYTSFMGCLISEATYWSFAGYFSRRQSGIAPVLTQVEEQTQVAQLVVDQITQSSFLHGYDEIVTRTDGENEYWSFQAIDTAELLEKSKTLNLRGYLTMEDTLNPNGQRKDTQQQTRQTTGGLYKLNPAHVRIHRGTNYLETLPPAISFWETFGLEPVLGPKDITSYCVHPNSTKYQADTFMERIGSTYSSAHLGLHSRPSTGDGLVQWSLNTSGERDYNTVMHSLQQVCQDLGTNLSNLPRNDENIVVYILNPFHHGAAVADICSSFLRLFHQYMDDASKRHARNFKELVLQIVPLKFVASADSLVIPPQSEYLRLALEVYSRCAPKGRGTDWTGCAPPVVLAEPIPRAVPFKLASDGVSPLEDGRCFHLAYSHSLDRRWITAAWTDYAGRYQMNMSYCLRERGSVIYRPVVEVLTDIWGATQDILGLSTRHWRMMIAKDEPLEREEIAAWSNFVQKHNQTKQAKVELTIFYVDLNPGLHIKVPCSPAQLNSLSQLAHPAQGSSTPTSTPIPGVPSPDPSSNASTPYPISNQQTPIDQQQQQQQQQPHPLQTSHLQPPSQLYAQQQNRNPSPAPNPDTDTDQILLVDKSDETWAITLSHRLNTSPTLTSYRPALASGYLLRRRGISDVEGLASLAVNVIYTQSRVPPDLILKDVLRAYRDLATLARTRGMAFAQGSCPLPWHVATAVRGQEALSCILSGVSMP